MTRTLFLLASLALFAKDPVAPVFAGSNGVAINGYDPVAYFTASQPVTGRAEFSHSHNGATFRFASAANRDQFAANPERFLPQFGGYCAWAVGHGYTAPTDPKAWKIIDGKLYLNYNTDIQKKWLADSGKWIASGNANWPKLHK